MKPSKKHHSAGAKITDDILLAGKIPDLNEFCKSISKGTESVKTLLMSKSCLICAPSHKIGEKISPWT